MNPHDLIIELRDGCTKKYTLGSTYGGKTSYRAFANSRSMEYFVRRKIENFAYPLDRALLEASITGYGPRKFNRLKDITEKAAKRHDSKGTKKQI